MKAAVAKATSPKGSNAKTYVIVLKFICLIVTYDKRESQVVSANIGGLGDRWVRKMSPRERKDCITNSGEESKKVEQMMEAAIKRRNIQGGKGTFSIAIDATEIAQFLEVSHAHADIIGGEYPYNLIPIDGMNKIKVQELLDGKLEDYGKVSIANEVKVGVMSFQDTHSDVPTMEVVAGRPPSKNESKYFIEYM